jgi:hypothetical protein
LIHEEKGADVDQHPEHVGDLGLCEEQQLLTRRTGVRDEGGGAAEGRPLAVVVQRKPANPCSDPIAGHERTWLLQTTPALHRGPVVGDDRSHVADEVVPNRIPRLGRIGVQRVPEGDERTRLLLGFAAGVRIVTHREDNQQSQQQAVGRTDEAEGNLVIVGFVALRPLVREHRQRDGKRDDSPKDEDANDHGGGNGRSR